MIILNMITIIAIATVITIMAFTAMMDYHHCHDHYYRCDFKSRESWLFVGRLMLKAVFQGHSEHSMPGLCRNSRRSLTLK